MAVAVEEVQQVPVVLLGAIFLETKLYEKNGKRK